MAARLVFCGGDLFVYDLSVVALGPYEQLARHRQVASATR